jgi:DNA-binding transcriptional regulator YiaG
MKNIVMPPPANRGMLKRNSSSEVRPRADAFLASLKTAVVQADDSVRQFCDAYGVTQDTFTRLTGFSQRAVANWAQGRKPSASTERRLAELKRLFSTLENLVAKEAIGPWLKESNPAFDGSTPLQVIERGEVDRLWRMIHELESGEPG